MDQIAAFYKFVPIENPELIRNSWLEKAKELDIKGTILVAKEGINGTISAKKENLETFLVFLRSHAFASDLEVKDSRFAGVSFRRMLVKVKKEIVTMRKPMTNPLVSTGHYLDAKVFQRWLKEGKELILVDTRNDYEVATGTFQGAIDPKIKKFSEFPEWVEKNLADKKDKTIVSVCTGGIRCEKATGYMVDQGFKEVYQLKGGILKYFEETMGEENFWDGDCVVFDKRKAVNKDLEATSSPICYICLFPLKGEKIRHEAGEACGACDASMKAFAENRHEKGQARAKENEKKRAEFRRNEALKYLEALKMREAFV